MTKHMPHDMPLMRFQITTGLQSLLFFGHDLSLQQLLLTSQLATALEPSWQQKAYAERQQGLFRP